MKTLPQALTEFLCDVFPEEDAVQLEEVAARAVAKFKARVKAHKHKSHLTPSKYLRKYGQRWHSLKDETELDGNTIEEAGKFWNPPKEFDKRTGISGGRQSIKTGLPKLPPLKHDGRSSIDKVEGEKTPMVEPPQVVVKSTASRRPKPFFPKKTMYPKASGHGISEKFMSRIEYLGKAQKSHKDHMMGRLAAGFKPAGDPTAQKDFEHHTKMMDKREKGRRLALKSIERHAEKIKRTGRHAHYLATMKKLGKPVDEAVRLTGDARKIATSDRNANLAQDAEHRGDFAQAKVLWKRAGLNRLGTKHGTNANLKSQIRGKSIVKEEAEPKEGDKLQKGQVWYKYLSGQKTKKTPEQEEASKVRRVDEARGMSDKKANKEERLAKNRKMKDLVRDVTAKRDMKYNDIPLTSVPPSINILKMHNESSE